MLTGYIQSGWHYPKPILDPILSWCLMALWYPLRRLYVATGKSSPILARWESTLWLRAAKHTQIQNIHYFEATPGTVIYLPTNFLGGKAPTVVIDDLQTTSYPDTIRLEFVLDGDNVSTPEVK